MTRPLLGISCCRRHDAAEPIHGVIDRYVHGAALTGADVLLVPAAAGDWASLARHLDGLLLTGSPSNMAPERYGAIAGDGPFDRARDATVLGLVDAMLTLGKPVFGICRGFQELNVAFGGTLRRVGEAESDIAHHAPDGVPLADMFAHGHPVTPAPGGQLAATFGNGPIRVNSVHYQGVDRIGEGLTVEAHAPDGLVEAFSAQRGTGRVLAVQWHPEWDAIVNPVSRWFFDQLRRSLHLA